MGWKWWSLVLDGLRTCLFGIWNFKKNKAINISVHKQRGWSIVFFLSSLLPPFHPSLFPSLPLPLPSMSSVVWSKKSHQGKEMVILLGFKKQYYWL